MDPFSRDSIRTSICDPRWRPSDRGYGPVLYRAPLGDLAGDPGIGLVLLPVGRTYGSYRSSPIEEQYSPTEKETWVSQLDN